MLAIGVDPDLHDTGIALVSDNGRVVMVGAAHVPSKVKGSEAVVAMIRAIDKALRWIPYVGACTVIVTEGQQKYKNSAARPEDLFKIAQVSGGAFSSVFGSSHVIEPTAGFIPTPMDWKGSVPKGIHQARILKDANIPFNLLGRDKGALPASPGDIPGGENLTQKQWHAVVDAIGLAQWGLAEVKRLESRKRRLKSIDESAGIERGPDGLPSSLRLL